MLLAFLIRLNNSLTYWFSGIVMSELFWNKPVLCIFKERDVNPEIDPFVVVKAKKLTLTKGDKPKYTGVITDFFTLMGDADYLATEEGATDHYVMCWFDDKEPDMTKDLRRLRGVAFKGKVTCEKSSKTGKRTYNATFNAEHGKL
jgi:hypothetical protein